jgi:hypothetical protein
MSTIAKLCHAINTARGIEYPAKGYLYLDDKKMEGFKNRQVLQVFDSNHAFRFYANGETNQETAANLRSILQFIEEDNLKRASSKSEQKGNNK